MRKLTCEPGTEISGATLLSLVENLVADQIAPHLSKYQLVNIHPEGWYLLQNLLDLLNDLYSSRSVPSFVAIGMSIADVALMPDSLSQPTFEQMLEGWNNHYQINHRYGNIGRKIAQKIDEKHYTLTLDGGVYPDDLEYGVVYGFAKRFLPAGTRFTVQYDKDVKRLDQGGTKTVIDVQWE